MKPVRQRYYRGRDVDGVPGDCHRACIASMLELPLFAVPHFNLEAEVDVSVWRFWNMIDDFLSSHGLFRITIKLQIQTLDELFCHVANWSHPGRDFFYVLDGESSTPGLSHSVIATRDRIVWNPSPCANVIGPGDFGGKEKEFRVHLYLDLDVATNLQVVT